ncbi:MAG: hypothetical protein AAGJ08_18780 [Cyanobacteria bacterium P01_H01_bin.35]
MLQELWEKFLLLVALKRQGFCIDICVGYAGFLLSAVCTKMIQNNSS